MNDSQEPTPAAPAVREALDKYKRALPDKPGKWTIRVGASWSAYVIDIRHDGKVVGILDHACSTAIPFVITEEGEWWPLWNPDQVASLMQQAREEGRREVRARVSVIINKLDAIGSDLKTRGGYHEAARRIFNQIHDSETWLRTLLDESESSQPSPPAPDQTKLTSAAEQAAVAFQDALECSANGVARLTENYARSVLTKLCDAIGVRDVLDCAFLDGQDRLDSIAMADDGTDAELERLSHEIIAIRDAAPDLSKLDEMIEALDGPDFFAFGTIRQGNYRIGPVRDWLKSLEPSVPAEGRGTEQGK